MRLWLLAEVRMLQTLLLGLLAVACDVAEREVNHVMPGEEMLRRAESPTHKRSVAPFNVK